MALSQDQLSAMMGMAPTPNQTANGFGAANGLLGNMINNPNGNFGFHQTAAQLEPQAQQAEQQAQQAASPMNIAGETARGTMGALFDPIIKSARSGVQAIGEMFGAKPDYNQTYQGIGGPQQTLQSDVYQGKTSPLMGAGEFALNAASTLPIGKLGSAGVSAAEAVAPKVAEAVAPKLAEAGGAISKLAKPITSPIMDYLAQRADKKATESLTQTIMPKLNAKEIKLALRDGRIQPGKDPSLLRGGTPDQIMPSKETQQSVNTIKQYIPDAGKLKAPELHAKIGDEVKNMGASLRPVMDTTKITPETIGKITKDWQALKAKQLADPYAPATANVEKLQADFENNFLKKSKAGNFGDLWDTRIAYDASVPANVKNATSLSSDALQTQKEIWLQNREILNSAINDSKSGLGEVSSKTFEEMNNLYNAQRGIESSYKPAAEGPISKIKQFAKDHPYMTGAGLLGANKVSKETTGIGIPTPF